jgi:hypothetical protein
MSLVFSPMDESVLETPPTKLYPKHAFIMRQLGGPAKIDKDITQIVEDTFKSRGYSTIDADGSVGSKDFLARILSLIRGTGFTVAIFSEETRTESLANIALELGFAAMCGKPLLIVKSKEAKAPSDLTRTDWIVYDPADPSKFLRKLTQAVDEIETLADYEGDLLEVAINGNNTDCAVAFERANKAFLLSGDPKFIAAAELIVEKLDALPVDIEIADLERLKSEIKTFVLQARRTAPEPAKKPSRKRSATR